MTAPSSTCNSRRTYDRDRDVTVLRAHRPVARGPVRGNTEERESQQKQKPLRAYAEAWVPSSEVGRESGCVNTNVRIEDNGTLGMLVISLS